MKKNKPNKERKLEMKKEAKVSKKEAKELKSETKKNGSTKGEPSGDQSKPKQRKGSFFSIKTKSPQEKEPPSIVLSPSPVRQRPSLVKSNSMSGVDREKLFCRFHSVQDVSQEEEPVSPSGFGSRLKKFPIYSSQMELPSINEDGLEGSRRSTSFTKRVTNLIRGASHRLRKSSESISRSMSGSLQNLRSDEYFGNPAPLTRTTSLLLPSKVIIFILYYII